MKRSELKKAQAFDTNITMAFVALMVLSLLALIFGIEKNHETIILISGCVFALTSNISLILAVALNRH
jgi:hypothetical protein